jgi:hypothetical protein
MNRSARNLLFLLFFLIPLLAASDEQQKAHKLLNKVNAMATDPAGKRAVSVAVAQQLSVTRGELTRHRREMNVNYGELFVAYQLLKTGTKMDGIAAKMRTGKTVWQAAEEEHADWKQIATEAKKLNARVDNNLIGHFANKKSEIERDRADGYDPSRDSVKADGDVSKQEIEDAQERYIFIRDHADARSYSNLDTSTEKAAEGARTDPVRTAGAMGAATPN